MKTTKIIFTVIVNTLIFTSYAQQVLTNVKNTGLTTTTSSTFVFQVNGNSLLSGNTIFDGNAKITTGNKISWSSNNWMLPNLNNITPLDPGIVFNTENNQNILRFSCYQNTSYKNGFDFVSEYSNSMLRITNEGIGIGTNDPKAKLHLLGGGSFSSKILLETGFNWSRKYSITNFSVPFVNDINNSYNIFSINDETNTSPFDASPSASKQANLNILKQISRLSISPDGNVGIGTIIPDAKLTVNGDIHAQELRIDLLIPTADYVFEKYYTGKSDLKGDYKMPTLKEVESYTKANHHLENIPSAKDIKEKGLKLGEMNNLLLQKVEELTLYIIELNKKLEKQQTDINQLKK